ncbi:oxygen-independent coproporphyrinogen III oxidase [Oceanicoccus sp. KOV_DT_Chl]|uniref:oxygen-independent coproporphyrinogen III oxidase n=1 Tax=Oceanicoccus sp. KOV_DT_Chl TaxID=1904639 RepID=UPI001F465EE1|nr:oxygen-independent coproporphyrinogen III oxidase [Oceanicoccus sp. KOV_DT_Chl]
MSTTPVSEPMAIDSRSGSAAIIATEPAAQNSNHSCRDADLISKYDVSGPRYTSYPTALQFSETYTEATYRQQAQVNLKQGIAPVSLYVHVPFCQNICYYCACNKIVTADRSVARTYLDYLHKEISLQSELVGKYRPVTQLHLGGGTPTFFDGAELTELMHLLASHYNLSDSEQREYSIEIDPRTVTQDSLALLKGLGFNRLSLGVQDFDEQVQRAINRRQSVAMIKTLTETARLYQFKSVSYDLIYGLPLQTPASLAETLATVIDLSPDRIAFYNYAHLPQRFSSQRAIDRLDLPSAQQKIAMLALIAEQLTAAGYRHIGMDHFVKPQDELARAQQAGKLQRNFQGYSTSLAQDLVGLGVSSISSLHASYAQNERDLDAYYQRLDRGELPISKGVELTVDDQIRRQIIVQLICNLQLSIASIEKQFAIHFSEYFSQELLALQLIENDGLLSCEGDKVIIHERGRPMLRNICMCFDRYLPQGATASFSQTL